MSSLLAAELAATCNALGSLDKRTGKYFVDGFTLDTVKDLIRYLRRDDEDHEIRRHLGQTKVLETDLLPILINHSDNAELFDVTLRLAVNLTNPPLLLYREEIPTEKSGRRIYLQLLSHLHSYKANSFSNPEIWSVLAKRLSNILEIDSGERDEDSGLIVERILILVRNILHVPADDIEEKRPDNDASVHDQVLWALNQSGLLDIILYMSSENEKPYFMHILEIVSLALREQNPTSLADAALQRSVEEKLKDEQELLAIRFDEVKKRNDKIRNFSANRHSRFGGTFVVKNMKSISDNSMICHKPLNNMTGLNFDVHKGRVKKQRNLKPAEDVGTGERRSAFAIRLFLKEFCIEFLNASYNTMMYYVRDVLVRSKAQKNDETYYLWAMKFFMEFNRNYNFQVKLVSETMSVTTFHFVQQQMEKYGEMMIMDKKKASEWMRRLHMALKAYHELLLTMIAMDKSSDKSVQESSKVIKSNIFYVVEYREFVLHMLLQYDDTKMPRAFLKDLIETVHIFLKMLEHFCKSHGLVVQKKVRSKAKKKSKPKPPPKSVKPAKKKQISEDVKNEMWEALDTAIYEMLQEGGDFSSDVAPFDAALEKDIDEQKGDCTKKIQKLLSANKLTDAIGLLRAAREVWPENDMFGISTATVDEELSILKMIFMANIGAEEIDLPEPVQEEVEDNMEDEDEENDDEDEEEDHPSSSIVEADFSFDDFINRFANPKVTRACWILLQNYEKNSLETNHCITKMFHRIAWDCKTPAMLFQASLFRTFQSILNNKQDRFKELQKFAIFIVRKFTEVALKNPKVFVELLFWKNSREAYEVEQGYEEDGWKKKAKVTWTEEQEEELRKLYNENQSNPTNDNDVIDWILENLIEKDRSRQGVIKKLKEMGLIFRAPTRKSSAALRTNVNIPFTAEEDEKLKELWDLYGSADDPMSIILVKMPINRPRHRFVERLLTLGIIHDKKECRKKTRKFSKSGAGHQGQSDEDISNSDGEQSDDSSSNTKRKMETSSSSSKKTKKQFPVPQISSLQVVKTIISCVNEGFIEPLKWIAESLEEVALDQEAEGYDPESEAVPIVPIMPECVDAMENALFQETLKCLGINPPFDEQESYWRIPSSIHFESLRKRCETIKKAIDKTLIASDEDLTLVSNIPSSVTSNKSERLRKESSSEDDDHLFEKLRSIGQTAEHSQRATTSASQKKSIANDKRKRTYSSSDDDNESNFTKVLKTMSKKKQAVESDSDSNNSRHSSSINNTTLNSESSNRSISKTPKYKKKQRLNSDSDSTHNQSTLRSVSMISEDSNQSRSSFKSDKREGSGSDSDSNQNTTLSSRKSNNSTLRDRTLDSDNTNTSRRSSDNEAKSSSDESSDGNSNNVTVISRKSFDRTKNTNKSIDSDSGDSSISQTMANNIESLKSNNVTNTTYHSDSDNAENNKSFDSSKKLNRSRKTSPGSENNSKRKKRKLIKPVMQSDSDSSDEEANSKESSKNNSNSISYNIEEMTSKKTDSHHSSDDSDGSMSLPYRKKRNTRIMSDDSDEELPQMNTEELFDSLL